MKKAYQKQCLIETARNGAKLCHTMTRRPGLCFSCSLPFILFNQDNGQVNKGIFMRGRMYILSITYLFPNSFLQYMPPQIICMQTPFFFFPFSNPFRFHSQWVQSSNGLFLSMQQFQNKPRSFLHYKLAFKINFNIEFNLKI